LNFDDFHLFDFSMGYSENTFSRAFPHPQD